jgi:uncharacterized protein YoxC
VIHETDQRSTLQQIAEVAYKVKLLQKKVATIMDQVQTFLAAFNAALTDIAGDLTTISTNLAANPGGGISATDAAALTAATTAIQALATQADAVATASGGPPAVAAAAKAATPAVKAANS